MRRGGRAAGGQRREAPTSVAASAERPSQPAGSAEGGSRPKRGQNPRRAARCATGPWRPSSLSAPQHPASATGAALGAPGRIPGPEPVAPPSPHSPAQEPFFQINAPSRVGGGRGEDQAGARLGCHQGCGICALFASSSQDHAGTRPGGGGVVERKAAEGPLAEQKRMGAVLARVETPSLSFPQSTRPTDPGVKRNLGTPG